MEARLSKLRSSFKRVLAGRYCTNYDLLSVASTSFDSDETTDTSCSSNSEQDNLMNEKIVQDDEYVGNITPLTMEEYQALRKYRDDHCEIASEITEAQKNCQDNLDEILAIEHRLLCTHLRLQLTNAKIRKDFKVEHYEDFENATASMSGFKFHVKPPSFGVREFYALVVIHDESQILRTFQLAEPSADGLLQFPDKFEIYEVKSSFKTKVQLYCLKMKTGLLASIRKSFRSRKIQPFEKPTTTLRYINRSTDEVVEKKVFETRFKLCGETTVDLFNYQETERILEVAEDSNLEPTGATFNFVFKKFQIKKLCDFVRVGARFTRKIKWRKYWLILDESCVLKGYENPRDVGDLFGEPKFSFELNRSKDQMVRKAHKLVCPERGFMLNVDNGERPGKAVLQYYFQVRDDEALQSWTHEVNLALRNVFAKKQ